MRSGHAAVRPRRGRLAALVLPLVVAAACFPAPAAAGAAGTEEVIFAGNNWEGTASVLDPAQGYDEIAQINIVPDEAERMAEILLNPVDLVYYLLIQQAVGEGHDQFVDDMYTTPDGELLIVSRPSFRDVVGIELNDCTDLADCEIAWRFQVAGQRSDHMAISPDGSEVAVSASTGNIVHILDTATGAELDQFPSGDSPHENTYTRNDKKLIHASIGRVYVPTQDGSDLVLNTLKGERVFYVVDTGDYSVVEDIDIREELDEAGHPELSEAVRPMALSRNEKKVYFQLSFFHGFAVYSFKKDRITKVIDLPNLVPDLPREQYLLNSAHHGIAMNGRGTRLCVAGTMSDYAAIVSRRSLKRPSGPKFKLLKKGTKPYWSTTSDDGKLCYVSWSGTDQVSIISYAERREVARTTVGDHPQRVRTGYVTPEWLATHGD